MNIKSSLDENNNNHEVNKKIPIFQLIFYFENFERNQINTTIPGYIQNIIYSLSIKAPQKLQEIVILNKEKILEIYSKNIDDDSIRQILLNLLTIQNEINNNDGKDNDNNEDYDYKQNLKERYFKSCIFIVDKFLSKYLNKFFEDGNKALIRYKENINNENSEKNDEKKFEFLDHIYDSKFKIKNTFILILKFMKFVDLIYQNKIDDILLRIFNVENLKNIEKILFHKYLNNNTDNNNNSKEFDITEIYLYEEFLFFFSYFLKICFNKKNSNKEYLMNNFFIDDYEKIYDSQNINNLNNNNDNDNNEINNNNKEESQEIIEGKVLSVGENISGKIDNLYSCSFNLEEKLNDSTKLFLLNFYFDNFEKFYNLANEIKKLTLNDSKNKNNNTNKIINKDIFSCSSGYIYFLDFLIVLFDQNKKEFSAKNIVNKENFPKNFFNELIEDLLRYRSNQFIQNKILRIFQLLNSEDNYENRDILLSLKENKILNVSQLNKLIENINFLGYINLER